MKNFTKLLGIIAFAAVIGFSMMACGGDDGGGGDDDGGEKVVLTMKFEENGEWYKPGNEEWTRWIYNYNEENKQFDLGSMYTGKKVYVFTYSFKSNIDIDSFGIYFYNMDDVDYNWQMISEWTRIKSDIKENTTYSGKVAIIPKENAVNFAPEFTSMRFDIMNRDVSIPTILSFYQFSLEQVAKETPGINKWTVSGKDFQITDTKRTFAETKTSFEGKSNVLHIKPTYNASSYNDDFVIGYDLSEYAGKKIEIVMSMDVYLKKEARIAWQINSSDPYYPVVCGTVAPDDRFPNHSGPALAANKWHTISGSNIITVPGSGDAGTTLYLSGQQIDGAEAYFANATFTVTQGSGGSDTPVTLNTVTIEGTPTNKIILTFSGAITGLTADNIILSGDVSGVTKGTLTGSGPTYTLPISGFTAGGKLKVWVSKLGYNISGSSKEVTILGTGGGNPFIGTWKDADLTVTCTATTWTATVPGYQTWSGSYVPNGNTANFIETNGNNFGTATISGNTMIVQSTYGTYYLTKEGGSSGGGGGGGGSGSVVLNGTWRRTSGSSTYSIVVSGNEWIFSENTTNIFKGTWTSSVQPAAPSSGTIVLTATHQNSSGGWISLPPQYESVKTNTATFSINSAGNQLTITNSASTNAEVWGKTEGTYTKN